MIKLSKLTDYAIVLLTYMSARDDGAVYNARQLAEDSQLPLPTVSKLLKTLSRAGLLVSQRGSRGGYSFAFSPGDISIAAVITAIEGAPALTQCSTDAHVLCDLEGRCPVRGNWSKINDRVTAALKDLSLMDMTTPQCRVGPIKKADASKAESRLPVL